MRSPAPLSVALLLALAACTTAPRPTPPAPLVRAAAPPVAAPAAPGDWRDVPETPGAWRYRNDAGGSVAAFGRAGAPADFTLRCDRATHGIALVRAGGGAGMLTVTTSYAPRTWPAVPVAGNAVVTLAARDPALDQIAFSRGRFTVALAGMATLVLPAWAEPARVIEDCRG